MRKITVTNPNGISIVFGAGSKYTINKLEGLGNPSFNYQEQRAPFQDGATPIDQILQPRDIILEGIIAISGVSGSAYLPIVHTARRELLTGLNGKLGQSTIIYQNDNTSYVIYGIPKIIFSNYNNHEGAQKYHIEFHCADPYWQDATDTVVAINTGETKQINSIGDVASPIQIIMKGTGYNPEFDEAISSNKLKINNSVRGNILIDTSFGNKKVVLKNQIGWSLSGVSVDINSIVYSETLKIWSGVGNSGLIIYSLDGTNWYEADTLSAITCKNMIWSSYNKRFMFVGIRPGPAGIFGYSLDGMTYSTVNSALSTSLSGIAERPSDGLLVAVGINGNIYTSSNIGFTWIQQTSATANTLNSVQWSVSANLFIAVGITGTIVYSSNGTAWSIATSGTANDLLFINVSGTQILAVGNTGTVLYSSNGTAWNTATSGTTSTLSGSIWVTNKWMVVGYSGTIITSANGIAWSTLSSGTTENLLSINYSVYLSSFVSSGSGAIIYSTNSTTWVKYITKVISKALCWSEDKALYVSVGAGGKIYTSSNEITWTSQTSGTTNQLNAVSYGKSISTFVSVGVSGTIKYSLNGTVWSNATSGTGNTLNGVDWNSYLSIFIACGDSGTVIKSIDGITWAAVTSGTALQLYAVTFSPSLSRTIIAGRGIILYTDNAISCSTGTGIGTEIFFSSAWSPNNGQFISVGSTGIGNNGMIYYSTNGSSWTLAINTDQILYGSSWSITNKQWIAVGDFGKVLSSLTGLVWDILSIGLNMNLYCVAWSTARSKFLIGGANSTLYSSGDNETNIIQYLSTDSKFFSLQPGINVLTSLSGGGIFSGTVTYRNRYIGV